MLFDGKAAREARLRGLARRIEQLRVKDEESDQYRRGILEARRSAIADLWQTCRKFADQLNAYTEQDRLELSPPSAPDTCAEDQPVELMLNVRGRVVLLGLRAPENLVATDSFKKPYILEGDVRFFNQTLLDNDRVEEHGIFFCPGEGPKGAWVYWNVRTYKSGVVDEDYLASLLEQIL